MSCLSAGHPHVFPKLVTEFRSNLFFEMCTLEHVQQMQFVSYRQNITATLHKANVEFYIDFLYGVGSSFKS